MFRCREEGKKRRSDECFISQNLLHLTHIFSSHICHAGQIQHAIALLKPCRHVVTGPRRLKLDAFRIECPECLE